MIDLRSDTVTLPSREMLDAMRHAALGDDVYGEDPTVNELEELAAELMGKQAAVLVPSGTMANLVSMLVHVPRGGEIIAEAESHIALNEAAGHAAVGGISACTVTADACGRMPLDDVVSAFRDPMNYQQPVTQMISIENTNAHAGGAVLPGRYIESLADIAHARGAVLHVDGARIFNAAAALGCAASDLVVSADSVVFCLSKGLGCPVGSMVVGSTDFVAKARRTRKLLGGGMRQAGVIAAAGLVALRPGPASTLQRLPDDHRRARDLAAGLREIEYLQVPEPREVASNIVLFGIRMPNETSNDRSLQSRFLTNLEALGVRMMAYPEGQIRAVTHCGVEDWHLAQVNASVERALDLALHGRDGS